MQSQFSIITAITCGADSGFCQGGIWLLIADPIYTEKKLTNIRDASADEAMRLMPVKDLFLEEAPEFISGDELGEVMPKSIRLSKRVLKANERPTKESKVFADAGTHGSKLNVKDLLGLFAQPK